MVLVSEAGLYKLVMRSDKPEAKAFQDWVTGTVLPGIRKDGGYIKGEEKVATGDRSEVLPSIREAPGTFHPTSVKPRDRL
jgi:prophage antirepressor-like protein